MLQGRVGGFLTCGETDGILAPHRYPQCSLFITLDRTKFSGDKFVRPHSSPSIASAVFWCLGMPILAVHGDGLREQPVGLRAVAGSGAVDERRGRRCGTVASSN
jgi:hypothetical protein